VHQAQPGAEAEQRAQFLELGATREHFVADQRLKGCLQSGGCEQQRGRVREALACHWRTFHLEHGHARHPVFQKEHEILHFGRTGHSRLRGSRLRGSRLRGSSLRGVAGRTGRGRGPAGRPRRR
jgi:hypothetical protein